MKYVFGIIKQKFNAIDFIVAENKRIKLRQKECKRQKKGRQEKAAKKAAEKHCIADTAIELKDYAMPCLICN